MCFIPKMPKTEPFDFSQIKRPAPTPTLATESIQKMTEIQRRRAASLIGGRESTIATSPQGVLSKAITSRRSLLGAG